MKHRVQGDCACCLEFAINYWYYCVMRLRNISQKLILASEDLTLFFANRNHHDHNNYLVVLCYLFSYKSNRHTCIHEGTFCMYIFNDRYYVQICSLMCYYIFILYYIAYCFIKVWDLWYKIYITVIFI